MNNAQRASELTKLRVKVQKGGLRTDLHVRRDMLGRIVPLMNFNDIYHTNALQFADILSQEGFSSDMYDRCEGRLDVLMGQAITELELDLTPPPPLQPGLVPTPALTEEHGLWWFVQHCKATTRWWLIVSAVTVLSAVIAAAYFAGRNHFINQVIDLWRKSSGP